MSPTILGIALTIILIKFNLANSQNANQKPFDENQLFSDVVYMNTQNFINSKKKKKHKEWSLVIAEANFMLQRYYTFIKNLRQPFPYWQKPTGLNSILHPPETLKTTIFKLGVEEISQLWPNKII